MLCNGSVIYRDREVRTTSNQVLRMHKRHLLVATSDQIESQTVMRCTSGDAKVLLLLRSLDMVCLCEDLGAVFGIVTD